MLVLGMAAATLLLVALPAAEATVPPGTPQSRRCGSGSFVSSPYGWYVTWGDLDLGACVYYGPPANPVQERCGRGSDEYTGLHLALGNGGATACKYGYGSRPCNDDEIRMDRASGVDDDRICVGLTVPTDLSPLLPRVEPHTGLP